MQSCDAVATHRSPGSVQGQRPNLGGTADDGWPRGPPSASVASALANAAGAVEALLSVGVAVSGTLIDTAVRWRPNWHSHTQWCSCVVRWTGKRQSAEMQWERAFPS